MRCPQFEEKGPHCRCRAVQGLHVPTLHERERHCTASYSSCPVLLMHLRTGRRLSDAEYLAVWGGADTAVGG